MMLGYKISKNIIKSHLRQMSTVEGIYFILIFFLLKHRVFSRFFTGCFVEQQIKSEVKEGLPTIL